MRRLVLSLVAIGLLSTAVYAKKIEQTICWSKEGKYLAVLGDNVKLQGGKCNNRTLPEMNKDGWKLIQVVGGLQSAFGMVMTREK